MSDLPEDVALARWRAVHGGASLETDPAPPVPVAAEPVAANCTASLIYEDGVLRCPQCGLIVPDRSVSKKSAPIAAEPVASEPAEIELPEPIPFLALDYRCASIDNAHYCWLRLEAAILAYAHPPVQPTPDFIVALQHASDWLQGSEPHRARYIGEVLAKYPPVQPTEPLQPSPPDDHINYPDPAL